MIVYCRAHSTVYGVVRRHPGGGFPELVCTHPRLRAHHLAAAGFDRRNSSRQRLDDRAVSTVVADGCHVCGPRDLPIKDLLAAFSTGLPKFRV